MAYLYIDSSNNLSLGLLNEEFKWVELIEVETRRTSDLIHKEILNLLSKHNMEMKDLRSVIMLAGPGSYTGMRVSEGMAQVFEMEDIKVNSFHAFKIPTIIGEKDFIWICSAFKGEYFVINDAGEKLLVKESLLDEYLSENKKKIIIHGDFEGIESADLNSLEVLKSKPEALFAEVVEKDMRDAPYYFRAVDVEFKKSSK